MWDLANDHFREPYSFLRQRTEFGIKGVVQTYEDGQDRTRHL